MSVSTILTSKRTISAIVCSLSIAAMAATPVAVWDGDFTATQTGFTLNRSGNAISQDNSTITIDQSVGVKVDFDSAMTSGMTVMFRYASLALDADKTMATSFGQGSQENSTGVQLVSTTVDNETVGVPSGFHSTSTTYNTGATQNNVTSSKSSGVMAFRYTNGGGTELYYISNDAASIVYSCSTLKFGADFTSARLKGCAIGGERDKSGATLFPAATGMKITGIAIFDSGLSDADMASYIWPSEVQTITVNDNTSVSAINALYDSTAYKVAKVTVADGVAITVDAAFSEKIQSVSSAGNITLSAESQPDASYNLANVDFSGVKGGLLRSWLTPGVVGFNFRSANGTDVSGALATADNWIHDNNSASGTSTSMFADGLSTLTWSSGGTWACSGSTIISGYLDDGANGGNGATVTLSNVPYETYDVIVYCSSDSNPGQFLAKTVNGTTYTWDTAAGAVVAGNAAWGKAALSTPVYGVNALRIKNLSGPLTIYGTARNGSNRGGIAAIEIMPPNTPDNIRTYTLTLSGTATTWSAGTWTLNGQTVDAPASGYVEIVASASTTLTVDQAVNLADLKVRGDTNIVINVATNDTGSLYAIKATVESGVFQQGSPAVLGTTPSIVVASGATFDENGMAINAANAVTIAGAGAGNWPWALTSSSGAGGAILGGLYLSANATIGGANELKVGQTQAGYQCYLQGFTLTKTGAGAFTGTNMNTPGTGTIDVRGGDMSVNQWNNLNNNGGDTTVILNSGTSLANVTDRIVPMSAIGLYGGTLSTASRAFKVKTALRGAGETANLAFGDGASASLTGDLTVTATMTLDGSMTFLKDQEATADVVVTPAALTASSGTITVGSGVTFNVGTSRPTATITVAQGGSLAAQLQTASDVIALSTSAQPANVILYDANGNVVSNPSISYSEGTLTIMPPVPTLEANGTVAFDIASNWNDSAMPGNDGGAIIELSGDAAITVSGTYTLASLTITGSGVATFSGEGSITVANISVKNGATFTRNANISATTGISIDSGTVLRLDGVTESAAISGAGAVETYGTVVLAHANTMTGGITVKTGSALSTTAAGGYGEYQAGWAYTAQRQVVVEDGGTVDINNVANRDGAVVLTIAGKGILSGDVYSGAVTYSGTTAITSGSRQISSLVLTGDALVDVGAGWGLVHSGWGNARLGLNGHTLTVRGTGIFPVVNVNNVNGAATTGTLVLDGATLELSNAASNLAGVNVIAKGSATINVATAPSALGSLTIKPSVTGTTASGWTLPSATVPTVDTSNIDTTGLTDGQVLTIFTAPSATVLSNETISVQTSTRFTSELDGNLVKVSFRSGLPTNFLHYDFNNGAAVNTGKAEDSGTQISSVGEAETETLVASKNGEAVKVFSGSNSDRYTPYWDTFANRTSPFHAGAVTVTTVAKMKQTGVVLWGLGNTNNSNPAMGLVVLDPTTAAVYVRNTNGTVEKVVEVSDTEDLTNGYHFYAVVANTTGTTLYVDGLSQSSDKVVSSSIGQQGQLGSFHGGVIGSSKVGADGYYLDDWRIYDTALTKAEVKTIKREICPNPLFIRLR